MVRLSMLMNNFISFCEGYSIKRYFRTKPGRSIFNLTRVSTIAEQIPSAKQTIVNVKARSMSAEILIYSSLGRIF